MPLNAIILLFICIFTFIPLLLAEYARNRSLPTLSDFFLQERNMRIFPMYATVFATWMSAFAFMGAVAYFYQKGPIYMTTVGWDAFFAVLFYLVGRRLWFYGKRYGYVTPTDFFNDIYNSKALNLLVTAMCVTFTLLYIQIQMAGALFLLQIATKGYITWNLGGVIFFAVLVIYLWAGGLRAVALTDAFYGLFIVTTILASGFFLMKTAGGMETLFQQVLEEDPSHVTLSGPEGAKRVGLWLSLFIIVPIGALMGPQMWLRNYAAKGESNFERLPFLLCLSSIICVGALFSGSAGLILNNMRVQDDTLLLHLMLKYAPPLFCVFIFLGIAAAIFSTANSQVHALAAIYTMDIHKKYLNRKVTEQKLLSVAKWTILAVSGISYALIYLIPRSIFDMGIIALGGMAQIFVPVIGALFWRKSTAKGAIAGLLSGTVLFFILITRKELEDAYASVFALLCNASVFALVNITHKGRNPVGEKIQAYRALFKEKMQR